MSRTDKTNPPWVKLTRREGNIEPWRIRHLRSCRGMCTPVARLPGIFIQLDCEILCSYYGRDGNKIYGRHPKRATRKASGRSRRHRAHLVRLRRQWLREPEPDTMDSLEGAPVNHRYLYDLWDWD
jgi:hypothetical protein